MGDPSPIQGLVLPMHDCVSQLQAWPHGVAIDDVGVHGGVSPLFAAAVGKHCPDASSGAFYCYQCRETALRACSAPPVVSSFVGTKQHPTYGCAGFFLCAALVGIIGWLASELDGVSPPCLIKTALLAYECLSFAI
jgi:hypothetical protein